MDVSFEKNKAEFKLKCKAEWHMHNEVCMQILDNEVMYKGISEVLTIMTRSETIGAAEGKCEGEVSKAKLRFHNRYRLKDETFGMEHVISELLPLFKDDKAKIYHKCAERYIKKFGKNTLRTLNTKSKFKISATLDKLLRKVKRTLIDIQEFDDISNLKY